MCPYRVIRTLKSLSKTYRNFTGYTLLQQSMRLSNKHIILGISGSIAAYKTPELVRQLVKAGAQVQVLCTKAATDFVSPLSLSTVSGHPVLSDVMSGQQWNNHVKLGRWADAMLIAPCSANTLGKLANGLCDNILNAVYLSANCPVFIAPAMDADMWTHPSTKSNLDKLRQFGNRILPVGYGELASGLTGEGRMAEPEEIVQYLTAFFSPQQQLLKGKKAMVTAGPTYERIDPVRFIGNFSTGKMGIALAESLQKAGADTTLILGPTHLAPENKNIKVIRVESADDMYTACDRLFADIDIAILSAAVADFRPEKAADKKIKKENSALEINLVQNKDILKHLGTRKQIHQTLVGFALETDNEEENAIKKLESKNADFIVLNSLKDSGAGFGTNTNKVRIFSKTGSKEDIPLSDKKVVADHLVDYIARQLNS